MSEAYQARMTRWLSEYKSAYLVACKRRRVLDQVVRRLWSGNPSFALRHIPECSACQANIRAHFARLWAAE